MELGLVERVEQFVLPVFLHHKNGRRGAVQVLHLLAVAGGVVALALGIEHCSRMSSVTSSELSSRASSAVQFPAGLESVLALVRVLGVHHLQRIAAEQRIEARLRSDSRSKGTMANRLRNIGGRVGEVHVLVVRCAAQHVGQTQACARHCRRPRLPARKSAACGYCLMFISISPAVRAVSLNELSSVDRLLASARPALLSCIMAMLAASSAFGSGFSDCAALYAPA